MNVRQEKELRRDLALVRMYLVEGLKPAEMCERLGCDLSEFEKLLVQFYEAEIVDIQSKNTERIYVDYVLAQSRNVHDLTVVLDSLRGEERSGGAKVSAIKARADIYDRIIAKGQEFGFVEKRPEAKIIAGVLVERMTNLELRATVTRELSDLGNLMGRYGSKTIIDVDPGPLHQQAAKAKVLPKPGERVKGRARNKVYGGRRIVKDAPS